MSDAMFKFRNICSMIRDPYIREQLEVWANKHIVTCMSEYRVDREAPTTHLEYSAKVNLKNLIEEVASNGGTQHERREWLQGDQKFGTIIRDEIRIVRDI